MIAIRTNDGAVFRGYTRTGIVRQMKRQQWNAPDRKGPWMEEVAVRVHQQFGAIIRTWDPDVFLNDLAAVGAIRFLD